MKKLILLAVFAIAATTYQPAKAQVSISLNIGPRPYYVPSYHSYTTYHYAPARKVYVQPRKVYYASRTYHTSHVRHIPTRIYHTSYRPAYRHIAIKHDRYRENRHQRRR